VLPAGIARAEPERHHRGLRNAHKTVVQAVAEHFLRFRDFVARQWSRVAQQDLERCGKDRGADKAAGHATYDAADRTLYRAARGGKGFVEHATGGDLRGHGVGFFLRWAVGRRDRHAWLLGRVTLLGDMRQLVRKQLPAAWHARRILALCERDVGPRRVGESIDGLRGARGSVIGVDANIGEVVAETRFHVSAGGVVEGAPWRFQCVDDL
jgi:hypothetical protein